MPLNELLLRMIEKDPVMRLSMKELKECLLKMNNDFIPFKDNSLNVDEHDGIQ